MLQQEAWLKTIFISKIETFWHSFWKIKSHFYAGDYKKVYRFLKQNSPKLVEHRGVLYSFKALTFISLSIEFDEENPQGLYKYLGQDWENIRKMFANFDTKQVSFGARNNKNYLIDNNKKAITYFNIDIKEIDDFINYAELIYELDDYLADTTY